MTKNKQANDQELDDYLQNGWIVEYESEDYITLSKKESFSILLFLVLFVLTGGIGAVLYLIYYACSKEDRITLEFVE